MAGERNLLVTLMRRQKLQSDKYMPQVVAIVKQELDHLLGVDHIVGIADPEDDMERNTDLLVVSTGFQRIACRVREPGYLRWVDQFTIRGTSPQHMRTEIHKVLGIGSEPFGDYMFYGHADRGGVVTDWTIIDLMQFRWVVDPRELPKAFPSVGGEYKLNPDKTGFYAFRFNAFPPELIVTQQRSN